MREKIKFALGLSLLSPFFGEMVSGSAPPLEFFNPLGFLFLWGLYGSGVLVVRELWVRWGKGFERLMLLGIFYGIFEEGLAVKSFFDPGWKDLDLLGTYGRMLGTNFVWCVWLSIFHAVVSITVPILLVHVIFPKFRDKRFLDKRQLIFVLSIFITAGILIFLLITSYRPPVPHYLITIVISVSLLYWAKQMDSLPLPKMNFLEDRPLIFGILFTSSMFVLFTFTPNLLLNHNFTWPVPCIIGILLTIQLYKRLGNYGRKQSLAIIIGILSPFLLFFDIILESKGMMGMSIVGIGTFIVLVSLYRRIDGKRNHPR